MSEYGDKIRTLVEIYGKERNYPPKSYLSMFCKDNDVNYSQWNAHIGGRQVVGIKILDKLMYIFKNLNMNWFLKDDPNMFLPDNYGTIIAEPGITYQKKSEKITNEDLMKKLEELEAEIKKTSSQSH
jgi:hypothetical protein